MSRIKKGSQSYLGLKREVGKLTRTCESFRTQLDEARHATRAAESKLHDGQRMSQKREDYLQSAHDRIDRQSIIIAQNELFHDLIARCFGQFPELNPPLVPFTQRPIPLGGQHSAPNFAEQQKNQRPFEEDEGEKP